MKKLLYFILITLFIGCYPSEKEANQIFMDIMNSSINDTMRLNDGHIYYTIYTHSGRQPMHSQYCICLKK